MIDAYLRRLSQELAMARVRGTTARRLLEEARGHLLESASEHGDEEALRSFGPAPELARLVAAELAASRTRRAALTAFAVLAVAGAAYAALFLTIPAAGSPDVFGGSVPGLGALALAGVVFLPQLAFVSGTLALVRVVRLRRHGAVPTAELRVQQWRTGVALGAGALTFASLVVAALDFRHDLAAWWVTAALVTSGVLGLALAGAAVAAIRSTRPRAQVPGAAETVFDDLEDVMSRVPGLGRLRLPHESRRFAFLVAAVAAAGVAVAGAAGMDPLDGLARALAEGCAVLCCYATLGRRLGLRSR